MTWHSLTLQYLQAENYSAIASFYEEALEREPQNLSHYWHLGLAYLLDGNEDLAQGTWLCALPEGDDTQINEWTASLAHILEQEAQRQFQNQNLQQAWLLCQHLREIQPTNLGNLLLLVNLSIELNYFEPIQLKEWQVANLLLQYNPKKIIPNQLLILAKKTLDYPSLESLDFTKVCIGFANEKEYWLNELLLSAIKIGDVMEQPGLAADLAEICLSLDENSLDALKQVSRLSRSAKRFKRSISAGEKYFQLSRSTADQFLSNNHLLGALVQAGDWLKIPPVLERHRQLLDKILDIDSENLDTEVKQTLITATAIFAYQQDNLVENRYFHNRVGALFQEHSTYYASRPIKPTSHRPLKIGYIAHTLRHHSVGWLSRWLFQYYDREKFHVSVYLVNESFEDEFYREWFSSKVENAQACPIDALDIADRIHRDEIDILVDLDSITLNVTYTALSFKPAPIQVSWLGWDAPGLPSVDYFIADPYVLPEDAHHYYQERIWRLPNSYVAVDGFEVGVPTVRRTDLDIPDDAVVFLSSQVGMKRHPSTVRSQLQILRATPNSYLIVKGLGDDDSVKSVFESIAEQENVPLDRLKFRGLDLTEYDHRANLQIADVVLDTYPYNGATTTLETLWMGIPLVTKAGKTFSSRNSYAFLKQVGVDEGIAWTDKEYVEWGIRLGTDEKLRQRVAWKLAQSRKTSPLWNAKQFTRDMENAYQQMWSIYAEQQT